MAIRASSWTMAINVSRELEQEIERGVEQGRYPSAEEFLRETLRRADEYREQLRAAIAEARAQADEDQLVDGEALFDRLDAELAQDEKRGRGAKAPL
jgi:putative addiction module CopG family antidote